MLSALIACLALLWFGADAPDPAPAFEVTYIANEGFLVDIGSKKILIDAIFDDETISYSHVPDATTLARMRSAEPPFDGLDLLLVTHGHRDHFSPGPVHDHLLANPDAVLIAPAQAVSRLRAVDPAYDFPDARIHELSLDLFEADKLDVGGIKVQAMRFHHSAYMETDPDTGEQRNRHAGVENIIYLIEVDEVSFLHVGDATLSQSLDFFESGRYPPGPIDIAFLEYFDWSDETRAVLDRWIRPEHIIFMHLPTEQTQVEAISGRLGSLFSNAVLFDTPLESRTFQPRRR